MADLGSKTFGELLRYYRNHSEDKEGRTLSQEKLGALIGDIMGDAGYSGAAVSYWERNKSQIGKDDRRVLTAVIKALHQCGGIKTLVEANNLLWAGNYRRLDEEELRFVFTKADATATRHVYRHDPVYDLEGASDLEEDPASRAQTTLATLWKDLITRPLPTFSLLLPPAGDNNSSGWSGFLAQLLAVVLRGWPPQRVLWGIILLILWWLTWELTFPLLNWPPASRVAAQAVGYPYIAGALLVPILCALLLTMQARSHWPRPGRTAAGQQETGFPVATVHLLIISLLGALAGFHLAYLSLVLFQLPIYYFSSAASLPGWLSLLAAGWPVLWSVALARQLPLHYGRLFGTLQVVEGDVALLALLILSSVLPGVAFPHIYPWLLEGPAGIAFILSLFIVVNAFRGWLKRYRRLLFPAAMAMLIALFFLAQQQTLLPFTITAGALATIIVLHAQNRLTVTLLGASVALGVAILLVTLLAHWPVVVVTLITGGLWLWRGRRWFWLPPVTWLVVLCAWASLVLVEEYNRPENLVALLFSSSATLLLFLDARRHGRHAAQLGMN